MQLDESDLKKGLKFIVGKWEVDYLVNAFSNNLEHIPPSEFKSKDGKDFSKISFEFFEDHTVKLRNAANGMEESGTWEQKTYDKFHYTFDKFFGELGPSEATEQLHQVEKDMEGGFVLSLLFLIIRFKKTEEGHVTEEKKVDIGDIEPTPEDLKMNAIVGRWKVYKTLAAVGDDFGMFTRADVEADLKKKKDAGQMTEEEYEGERKESLSRFDAVVVFSADHKVKQLMAIPAGVPQEEIDAAVAAGEVKLEDGMMVGDKEKEWKYVKGEYWYNSEEERMVFDEKQSPWDKITPDADGHIDFHMYVLEKEK